MSSSTTLLLNEQILSKFHTTIIKLILNEEASVCMLFKFIQTENFLSFVSLLITNKEKKYINILNER